MSDEASGDEPSGAGAVSHPGRPGRQREKYANCFSLVPRFGKPDTPVVSRPVSPGEPRSLKPFEENPPLCLIRGTDTPDTEALLVLAASSQHVTHLIRPALDRGAIVLCDRFADSTFAYQGFGRRLSLSWLQNCQSTQPPEACMPHLTLLLDVPVSIGLARRRRARGNQNRLDRESAAFHQRVRQGFLTLASRAPRRIKVINANRPADAVRAEIEAVVLGWLRNAEGAGPTHDNMPFRHDHWPPFDYRLAANCGSRQRLAHAYLFHGEDAIGKRTTALCFAQALLASMVQPNAARCLRNLPLLPTHRGPHASRLLCD